MNCLRYANAMPTQCQRNANGMHRAVSVSVSVIVTFLKRFFLTSIRMFQDRERSMGMATR